MSVILPLRVILGSAGAAVLLAALQGCAPANPALFDPTAVRSVRRVAVLPLTDGPGPAGKNSGKVVSGVVLGELVRMGKFNVLSVSDDALKSAAAATGLTLENAYDPAVAAALGKELGADAVVCGELTHFGTQKEYSGTSVLVVAGGGTSTTHWVGLNLRLVQCRDAKIIYTGAGSASSPEGVSPATAAACRRCFAALKYLLEQPK